MFDVFDNRLTLRGTLTTKTALRIGAGRATGVTGTDLPVVRDAAGRPYIPGSSLKGALRAGVESLVRSVRDDGTMACNPVGDKRDWCLSSPDGLSDAEVEARTCLVCRVFGSPWMAARVSVRDLPIEAPEERWFGQFEVRNGVAIDRDTETARDGKLYDFEVVPAGTRFSCVIVAENASVWQRGLLMAALMPFERGEGALGGARSRGLGVAEIAWDWQNSEHVEGADLLDWLAGENGVTRITPETTREWLRAFAAELREAPHA